VSRAESSALDLLFRRAQTAREDARENVRHARELSELIEQSELRCAWCRAPALDALHPGSDEPLGGFAVGSASRVLCRACFEGLKGPPPGGRADA